MPREFRRQATRAVRAGVGTDANHGAVMPPIYLSSNFTFEGFGQKRRYDYTRSGNPTRDQLAMALAEMENGAAAIITNTGMSAVTLIVQLLAPGDLIIAPHDCYGGTHRLLTHLAKRGLFRTAFVDLTHPSALTIIAEQRPRLVLVETPSNPLLRITDISAVAIAVHAVGALLIADNTFLSPVLQEPMRHGADVVIHSTTKYLNGHSDVVGGAVVVRDSAIAEELAWWANCLGLTGAPFDAYLTLRGIRSLHCRIRQHEENAYQVVELLSRHEIVRKVHYPGLPNHPGREIVSRQQYGGGGMVSFELQGGIPAVQAFLEGLECFTLAESLGGVESLVAHPATMTHASMDAAARKVAGITDGLLRLSVGIESAADLVEDLEGGLRRASIGLLLESRL